ncbi:DUF4328 domain-containing protein [Streptomyces monticola]|uniref:DUF4328 domain-containing protein n=1 Tax=Streptomyces monticola TaxID=2666263 RepID=A0ABW2JAP1_9ACTN
MSTPSPAAEPQGEGSPRPGIRLPHTLGHLASGALAVTAVATVAAAVAQWHMDSVIGPLHDNASVRTADGYIRADMWLGNLLGALKICLGVTVVLLAVWFARMRANARLLDPAWQQRHGAGWLLLSFLCAIGLLFVPKMIVNDIWAASTPRPDQRRGNGLLTVWWLAVVAAVLQLSQGLKELGGTDATWEVRQGLDTLLLADVPLVVACALTFLVVRRLGALQAGHPAAAQS